MDYTLIWIRPRKCVISIADSNRKGKARTCYYILSYIGTKIDFTVGKKKKLKRERKKEKEKEKKEQFVDRRPVTTGGHAQFSTDNQRVKRR